VNDLLFLMDLSAEAVAMKLGLLQEESAKA
jgi:hypothetical protein